MKYTFWNAFLLHMLVLLGCPCANAHTTNLRQDSIPDNHDPYLKGYVRVWDRLGTYQCEDVCKLEFMSTTTTYNLDADTRSQYGDFYFYGTGNWSYSIKCATANCNGTVFTSRGRGSIYLADGYNYNLEIKLASDNSLFLDNVD